MLLKNLSSVAVFCIFQSCATEPHEEREMALQPLQGCGLQWLGPCWGMFPSCFAGREFRQLARITITVRMETLHHFRQSGHISGEKTSVFPYQQLIWS